LFCVYFDVITYLSNSIYNCHLPTLLVSDPDMLKEIFIKNFSNFTNRPVSIKLKLIITILTSLTVWIHYYASIPVLVDFMDSSNRKINEYFSLYMYVLTTAEYPGIYMSTKLKDFTVCFILRS
jgi:hypothetical protein